MSEETMKLEFIMKRLNKYVLDSENRKFMKDRLIARIFKISAIVVGSLVTVLLGTLKGTTLAFILSATLTLINTIDSLFNYSAKSIQAFSFIQSLSSLRNEILYYKVGRPESLYEANVIDAFHDRLLQIEHEYFSIRTDTIKKSFEEVTPPSKSTTQ